MSVGDAQSSEGSVRSSEVNVLFPPGGTEEYGGKVAPPDNTGLHLSKQVMLGLY